MNTLTVSTPEELKAEDERQLEVFAQFVKSAGEASALHVETARCLVRVQSSKLIGTAALKTDADYRANCFREAGLLDLANKFDVELGYIVIDPKFRGCGLSYLVTAAALTRRDKSGVYATSNLQNLAMHRVLESRGFTRAGVPWESKQKKGEYIALFLSPGK